MDYGSGPPASRRRYGGGLAGARRLVFQVGLVFQVEGRILWTAYAIKSDLFPKPLHYRSLNNACLRFNGSDTWFVPVSYSRNRGNAHFLYEAVNDRRQPAGCQQRIASRAFPERVQRGYAVTLSASARSQIRCPRNRPNTLQTAYTASHVKTGWSGWGRRRYFAALWPFDRRGVAGVAAMRHDHSGDIS